MSSSVLRSPLGVDFGKARIGLATCPSGLLSAPLKILGAKGRLWLELAEDIIAIAQQHGTQALHALHHHPHQYAASITLI